MALGLRPLEIVAKGTYPLLAKADHWERVPLSDVAHVQNGFAFKSSFFHHYRGVPLIRIRDISKEQTEHRYWGEFDDQYIVKPGEILVGMDGDFSVSRWTGEKGLLNQRVCKITLTSDLYDEGFLYHCLQPFLNAINVETSSVTVKHLSSKTVQEIPLPLPPLPEQRRIVPKIKELFSELDKGVESLKAARTKLKAYRQSVLKHAFEGKLTAQWREENKDKLEKPDQLLSRIKQEREARYEQQLQEWKTAVKKWEEDGKSGKRPAKPKRITTFSKDLVIKCNELPLGWTWAKIESIFDVVSGGTPKGLRAVNGGDLPFYKVSDMNTPGNETRMDAAAIYLSTPKLNELGLKVYPKDTVIFPKRGGAILTNKKRILSRPSCFDLNIMGVTNSIASISNAYLWHWFQSLNLAKIYDGSNVPQINKKNIAPLPFPICSIEEQHEIANILGKTFLLLEEVELDVIEGLQNAHALRQSILKTAFKGELVAQDPIDEPASVLLDRIKADREKALKKNRSRKTKKRKAIA